MPQSESGFRAKLGSRCTSLLRSRGASAGLIAGEFVVVSGAILFLAPRLQFSTAAAWLFLPLVLLVTLRWGLVPGLLGSLAAEVLVLTFSAPPIGLPVANDRAAYMRLGISAIGMALAVVTVADLVRRRHAVERQGHAETEMLADIGRRISASLDLDQVLQTAAEATHRLVRADMTAISIIRDSTSLEIAAVVGSRTQVFKGLVTSAHAGFVGEVLQTSRWVRVHRDSKGTPASPPAIARALDAEGIVSSIGAPIQHGSTTVGVFWAHSRTHREFTDAEAALLNRLAAQAGLAIANAQAHAQEQAARHQVEALLCAADQLNSTTELEEVLHRIVSIAADLVAVRRAGIATNEHDHALRRHTWLDGVWHSTETRMPLDGSLSGWVITHGAPFRTIDFPNTPQAYLPASPGLLAQMALAVPILGRDGHVLGSLNLFDRRDRQPFTDEDQRLAEGIAHHAAIAMERAKLVAELRTREQHLQQQAVTDPLTGLPNRILFLDRLAHALAASRRAAHGVAVLFLDLDGFKIVNDSLGHPAGDQLLRAVSKRLVSCQREGDTVARFGGDEFAILLEQVADAGDAVRIAGRIIEQLKRPFRAGKYRGLFVTASIGVSFRAADIDRSSAEELIREADIALYRAKAAGKAQVAQFLPSMSVQALDRLKLHAELNHALDSGELQLLFQPIIALQTRNVAGVEALLRWQHPQRGIIGPDDFMDLAEETGLILRIGRWVLQEACRRAAEWQRSEPGALPFGVSVNLSARQFEEPNLVDQVAAALHETGLNPSALTIEITETAVIARPDAAILTLTELKQLGVRLAIDDFGTGYSSLSYLQHFMVDALKIDQSFVQDVARSEATAAIVIATLAMAHALGIAVTAEGIESDGQLTVLAELGCDYGQGFYLSEPLAAEGVDTLLRGVYA